MNICLISLQLRFVQYARLKLLQRNFLDCVTGSIQSLFGRMGTDSLQLVCQRLATPETTATRQELGTILRRRT